MLPNIRLLALLVSAIALVGLSGCGDDSDDAAGATITKAEFVKRATAICKARGDEIRKKGAKVLADTEDLSQSKAATALVAVSVPAFERELRELSELEAPAGDAGSLDAVFDEIRETINRLKKSPGVVRNYPNYPYRHSEQAAAAYGIPACGRP